MRMDPVLLSATTIILSFFIMYSFHPVDNSMYDTKAVLDGSAKKAFGFGYLEDKHMNDVFRVLQIARVISAIIIILFLLRAGNIHYSSFYISSGITLLILLSLVVIPWSEAFSFFHAVFFPQGNWMFPASSPLIRQYPEQFFVRMGIIWGVLAVIISLSLAFFGFLKQFSHKLFRGQ